MHDLSDMNKFEKLNYHDHLASKYREMAEAAYKRGDHTSAATHAAMATMHYAAYTALMQK